jgi:hypothetical protein
MHFPLLRKEWLPVRRILLLGWLAVGLGAAVQAQGDNAVAVVVVVEGDQVTSVDVSFPAVTNMNDIQADLKEVSRWTGWAMVGRPAETSGHAVSVHSQVSGGQIDSILNDAVWPLVAALAPRQQLGVVVRGAQVAAAPLTFENRFVRLEQSGGQGVQFYHAYVKDTGFRSLDELRSPAPPGGAGPGRGSMMLAWLLVIVAAAATGFAVYMLMYRRGR